MKKLTKEQKRQQANKARKNPQQKPTIMTSYVKTPFMPTVKMHTWDNTKTVLRLIGYDAFEHFGLTRDEAKYLASRGDWTCFVDSSNADSKTGNRYAASGDLNGESDEQFVFATALDVLTSVVSIAVLTHKMTDAEATRYAMLIDKMAVADKEVFKWYFTTNPNFPKYNGDYSDFSIINAVHTFINEQSEYCVNCFLKPYGLSTKSAGVYTTTAY